ncbi:MAG: disulfide bond formation protein B [Legionellales bacterium]|nr:disulfide bond formation protein B [Legionellales bacterium]
MLSLYYTILSQKNLNLLGFFFSGFLIVVGICVEYFLDIKACPLCIVQRVVFGSLSILFLVSFILFHRRNLYIFIQLIIVSLASIGLILALRQSYLQLYPDPLATCGISFDFVINNFPILDIIKHLFNGTGDCQEIQWTLLGLTIPMWASVWFAFFLVLGTYLLTTKIKYLFHFQNKPC